ncbi:MAG: DNA primase [Betaproteobacteria bacterium RIFCSPLOWO2_12_FULL_62_13b]|nr:MAG: DNA primase [Betaproteobacteria bacterium RIFCSPLOWO2_12_FULL_62_13b]
MTADALLSRLNHVKRTGPGRWLARCPAHEDKSPSMSIRELDDGRVLLHDFAGCSIEEILGAVGMTFDALFPERPIEHGKPERRPFLPADVFDIARREIGIIAILTADFHKNKLVSEADYERIFVAVERLNDIAGAAYGR